MPNALLPSYNAFHFVVGLPFFVVDRPQRANIQSSEVYGIISLVEWLDT